jgi:hypothetical protein
VGRGGEGEKEKGRETIRRAVKKRAGTGKIWKSLTGEKKLEREGRENSFKSLGGEDWKGEGGKIVLGRGIKWKEIAGK